MQSLKNLIFLILIITLVCSCGKDSDTHQIEDNWSVINLSGGIAGFDCDFELTDYEWSFKDGELIRQLNQPSSCITLIEKDTFNFSILEDTDREFLELDTQVFGEIIFANDTLSINTNSHPNGSGADGFAYLLVK